MGDRNFHDVVGHHWADALEPREVLIHRPIVVRTPPVSQIVGPIAIIDWYWRSPEELPEPGKKSRHEPAQRKAYLEHLANRGAEEPFEEFRNDLDALVA